MEDPKDTNVAELKKPGWELGKPSKEPLPGHGGVDLGKILDEIGPYRPTGWTPGVAGKSLAYGGSGGARVEEDWQRAEKIKNGLLAAAEKERLAREGK